MAARERSTQLRLILADFVTDAGRLRAYVEGIERPEDRAYLDRETDRLQEAVHRMLAFLDTTEGEERN